MNKYLKVLLISIILLISFLLNFENNISYGQNKNTMDELISISEEEEYLNKKINDLNYILKNKRYYKSFENNYNFISLEKRVSINSLKYIQINLLKILSENELNNCKKAKELLIKEVKMEKEEILKNSDSTYVKGRWPLENHFFVSSEYGYRVHPITNKLSFHTGIDIPAPKNTKVLASDDGIVIFAGYKKGYGNVVEIDHFDNKQTLYAHNNSISVKVGDVVKRGQVISQVGSTGNSTGNHVHFEVKINNKRINPIYGVNKEK